MTPEYLNVGGLTLGIVNFTIVLVNCLENELSHPVIRGQTKNMVRPPPLKQSLEPFQLVH